MTGRPIGSAIELSAEQEQFVISCKLNKYFSQALSKCDDPGRSQSCGSGIESDGNSSLTAWPKNPTKGGGVTPSP